MLGLVLSLGVILVERKNIAYSTDVPLWNQIVAGAESANWSDIFSVNGGQDLYTLVYQKTLNSADDRALSDTAKNFGLTRDEAQAVLDGSITPIFNNPDRRSTELTQEEALGILNQMQNEFDDLRELYQIQQEVELAVQPSEIFADGELANSGFDLLYDLNLIEEILFAETEPVSVGGIYEDALDSPFNPTEDDATLDDFVASETPVAVTSNALSINSNDEGGLDAVLNLGDRELPIEVLENDICLLEDVVGEALGDLAGADDATGDANDANENDPNAPIRRGDVEALIGDELFEDEYENSTNGALVQPAEPGQWGETWCPGFPNSGSASASNFSEENFEQFGDGFVSLGGSSPAPLFAGASSSAQAEGFQASAAVCIGIKMIDQTYASFNPGKSCVQCEIEQINQLLDQTLSHSLIPNKATGNLLESAKCKETGGALLNFQFITIWNPIPTPPNDELVFGNNIFDEWNKFASRYQPVLLKDVVFDVEDSEDTSEQGQLKFFDENAPAGISQQQVSNEVNQAVAKAEAEAIQLVKELEKGKELSNDVLTYDQNVLAEMQDMNRLFAAFKGIFAATNTNALEKIKEKPNL